MSAMLSLAAFLLVDVNAAPAKVYQYDDAACTVGKALLSTQSTIEKISDGSTCFKGIAYGNPNSEHDKCYQAGEVIVRTLYGQSDCHMDKPTWRSRVINITKATYQKYLNKECFTMLGSMDDNAAICPTCSGQVGDRYWKLEAGDPAVPDCMESYMQSITPATTAPTTKGPSMAPTSVAPTGKVLTGKLVVTFDDPASFIASPHAKPVMKTAIANSSADLTTDMITIGSLALSSGRRLSVSMRRLAGGVDCLYTVTYPPGHTGATFTAASIDKTKLKQSITQAAATLGLTVNVTNVLAQEPQLVTTPAPTTTKPGVPQAAASGTADKTVAASVLAVALMTGRFFLS